MVRCDNIAEGINGSKNSIWKDKSGQGRISVRFSNNTVIEDGLDDIGIGDNLHYKSDDEIQTLGLRFWKALEDHYYSGTTGRGPVITLLHEMSNFLV